MLTPLFLLLLANVASAVLQTSGRWIVDQAKGQRVKLRCANWAGHLETNVPEGLQHQPVEFIARWLKENNFNCVRLTFSIDMTLNPDQCVSDAFVAAATPAEVLPSQMAAVYNQTLVKNPWLADSTTRGAFKRVIEELGKEGIMVILSNHVSRASWCCSADDGNGWWESPSVVAPFSSRFFKADEWIKGLRDMASFARKHDNVVGIALRNGLRHRLNVDHSQRIHDDWYRYMTAAAEAVHEENKNLLIVVGGTDYGTDLSFIWDKQLDSSAFVGKLVYEFNHYMWSGGSRAGPWCQDRKNWIGKKTGFLLEQNQTYTAPLILGEFGWTQNDPSSDETFYAACITGYMTENDAEWAYWALQGSYYVRNRAIDHEEVYGLLNSNWSDWRDAALPQVLAPLFNMTQGPDLP